MDDSALQEILSRLPECQRDMAAKKIQQAEAYGWTEIHLDPPENASAHHLDLFGLHPIAAKMRLLPETSDVKE